MVFGHSNTHCMHCHTTNKLEFINFNFFPSSVLFIDHCDREVFFLTHNQKCHKPWIKALIIAVSTWTLNFGYLSLDQKFSWLYVFCIQILSSSHQYFLQWQQPIVPMVKFNLNKTSQPQRLTNQRVLINHIEAITSQHHSWYSGSNRHTHQTHHKLEYLNKLFFPPRANFLFLQLLFQEVFPCHGFSNYLMAPQHGCSFLAAPNLMSWQWLKCLQWKELSRTTIGLHQPMSLLACCLLTFLTWKFSLSASLQLYHDAMVWCSFLAAKKSTAMIIILAYSVGV